MKENKKTEQNCEQTAAKKSSKKRKTVRMALLSTVVALGVSAIVGLSVALAYSQDKIETQARYQRDMDAAYSRAYYDLLDSANDMEIKLRKLNAASSVEKQQALLYEVWGTAGVAENNLGVFESNDEGLLNAQKFVNQLGDYAHSLALKLSDGERLSAQDRARLSKLSNMAGMLKTSLNEVQKGLDKGELFVSESGGILGNFADAFGTFSDPSVEYPEMIYDGPFSDSLRNRETRGLTGKEINGDEGLNKIKAYLPDAQNVQYNGETTGDIKTLNYTADVNGNPAFIQLSKKGGRLISYNSAVQYSATDAANVAHPSCQQAALEFAKSAGYDGLEVVWSATAEGGCLVNLAPVENGVVIYPDLVKVKLNDADATVTGFDAMHYAFNHQQRDLKQPTLSEAEARAKISIPIVSGGRLTLIPLQETREVLTYEFECESNGTYFIYIDANTGREANILYVVDTDMGQSLI